jgi:hypothetical protein
MDNTLKELEEERLDAPHFLRQHYFHKSKSRR